MRFPLIYLATENEDVYCILKYLDMEANWTTYYKLMESIKTFAVNKGIEINTIKDEKTLEAFRNTANNFSLSKLDSRHGFKNQNKKNKTDSISLDDTHKFFIKMAKEFLVKVYFTPFNPFNNLAKLYEDQGNYAKAKYFYERSLEIFEKFLSKEHPNTRQVRENYNALIQKMQDTKF
jgi:tetratricopeptide (TPR) repeat protein